MPDLLSLPPPERLSDYESVALFAQRAVGVDPDFAITGENARAVGEICARLDGLPLAIELAASRIRVLSPSAMLARLQHRLDLLTGGPQDAPLRQRTLRETIRWSYELLDRPEQMVFSRLAAFVGGWTIEGAEAVANPDRESGFETLDVLGSLLDKSLVRKQPNGGEPRFGMLETIREFGEDVLEEAGESNEVRRRHASYFLAMAEEAEPELTGGDQRWLDRLEREHDNLRAALRWTIDAQEAETGLLLSGALWRFWRLRGHLPEGRRWTEEVLALPASGARTAARAKALIAAGSMAYWLRDTESARRPYEESLAISRELGDPRGEAEGAYNLAFERLIAGDLRSARELHERAAGIYGGLGDEVHLAFVNTALAMVAYREDDLEAAVALTEEARRTFQNIGATWGIAMTSGQLAAVALKQGDHARARAGAIESIEVNQTLGNTLGVAVGIQALALVAIREGRTETGVRLAGAMDRIKEVAGGEAPPAVVGLDDPREIARLSLTEERITALWEEGRAMSTTDAIALARQES